MRRILAALAPLALVAACGGTSTPSHSSTTATPDVAAFDKYVDEHFQGTQVGSASPSDRESLARGICKDAAGGAGDDALSSQLTSDGFLDDAQAAKFVALAKTTFCPSR